MNLEDQVKDALRRQDPPEGFAERVIRRAGPAHATIQATRPRRSFAWRWPAMAAVAAALAFGIFLQYRRAQEARASQQAIQALRIVAEELNMAQIEVLNK